MFYQNGTFTEHIPKDLGLEKEIPCIILIYNRPGSVTSGLGCFYGNGHVLTALHVLEDHNGSEIYVIFTTSAGYLVFKCEFTKNCNTYPDRDQAFLKLLGNTKPLGAGLQNQRGHDYKQGFVYFFILTESGKFQKQECRIKQPNSDMKRRMIPSEFITSKAGRPGDSGSPVFCNGKWIGVYFGSFHNESATFGRCSEMCPVINPWASPITRHSNDC